MQHQLIESEYLPYLREYRHSTITVILMFNGDVNFDFSKTVHFNSIVLDNKTLLVKLKIYFVSKQSLFMHFRESNGQ